MAEKKQTGHQLTTELKERILSYIVRSEEEYYRDSAGSVESCSMMSEDIGFAEESVSCDKMPQAPAASPPKISGSNAKRKPGKKTRTDGFGGMAALQFSAKASFAEEYSFPEPEGTFVEELRNIIRTRDIREPDLYHAVNMDHKLFNKIINDVNYHPKKTTALQLCIGLNLNLEETKDLIGRAGYALTHSSRFDIIVEYFLRERIYDIYLINETLFDFDQQLFFGIE